MHGLTVIGFVGSVFSPYYAWSRRHGAGLPERHCALNVALYGPSRRWAMTERGGATRSADSLAIGPSSMRWTGSALEVAIEEVSLPIPRRLRGIVRLQPNSIQSSSFHLDRAGRHRWQPIAPCARIEVALSSPALSWQGHAYFDTNWGDRPLEADFASWNWSRATLPDGDTVVLYDANRLGETEPARRALRYGRNGGVAAMALPPLAPMAPTRWRLRGEAGAEDGFAPRLQHSLEDGPFYARRLIRTRLAGVETDAMHETLSLTRFSRLGVQAMLPFRMPRRF